MLYDLSLAGASCTLYLLGLKMSPNIGTCAPREVKSILLESGLEEQFGSTLCSERRRTRLGVDGRGAVWGLVGLAALGMEGQNPSLLSRLLWLSPSFPPGDGLEP